MDQGKPVAAGIGAHVDRLGYLWVGHWWKLCRYQVLSEPPKPAPSQLYIREVQIDSLPVTQRMMRWDHHQLLVEQPDPTLSVQFRAINPLSFVDIRYVIQWQEQSDDWVSNGNSEWIQFSDLQDGLNTFRVRQLDPVSGEYNYSGPLVINYAPRRLVELSWLLGLLGLLIASLAGFFLYRNYVKRQQARAAERYESQIGELREAALRAQMNPHFLFNSLNSIRYLILSNDNDQAAAYLTKFSRLMRMILEHSKLSVVQLSRELDLLSLYIELEKIRFEQELDYQLKIDENINPEEILIPPMLLQPYVENAILHGINPMQGRGLIEIEILKRENNLNSNYIKKIFRLMFQP